MTTSDSATRREVSFATVTEEKPAEATPTSGAGATSDSTTKKKNNGGNKKKKSGNNQNTTKKSTPAFKGKCEGLKKTYLTAVGLGQRIST